MVTSTDTQFQQAQDSFDGLDVTLESTLPTFATDSFQADIDITVDGLKPTINVALVVDTSGSTAGNSGSDVDGDGTNDTFLEAQQFAAKAFFQNLIDAGYPPEDVTITFVEYNSGAQLLGTFTLDEQAAFEGEVDALNSGGGTNFEAGLDTVIDTWTGLNADGDPSNDVGPGSTNAVVFLSDGVRNGGDPADDEAQVLLDSFNAPVTAIGVGANASLSDLNVIDTTGGAEQVVDASNLADVINAPPPLPELETVQIIVDGQVLLELPVGDPRLIETPLGYTVDCIEIEGYPYTIGEDLEVEIKATFNNGADVLTLGNIIIPQTVCFVAGTLILTAHGPRAIETLTIGDRVVTRDAGMQPVHWIGASRVTSHMMARDPALRPIRVARDAFGAGMPSRDLFLSRQHRVLVRDWRAEVYFGVADGVLAPAAALVNDATVTVDHSRDNGVTYFHLATPRHAIIYAEGVEVETFLPSARTLAGMGDAARAEFLALFPVWRDGSAPAPAVHPNLSVTQARVMAP
ncbi:MAG: Hint domain-containing protein [Shimia sp.]